MSRRAVVEIGNAHGRIALYLDEREAIDLAEHYGRSDEAYRELMEAVEKAYPPPSDEPSLGVSIYVRTEEPSE